MQQCEKCETGSLTQVHNHMHVWLRISVPLTRFIEPCQSLLPILYQSNRAGSDKGTLIGGEDESTATNSDKDVVTHANVLWYVRIAFPLGVPTLTFFSSFKVTSVYSPSLNLG